MSREGFPGGCNPADVLYKLAHNRGIKPPVFEMISEQGPPHARTFTWSCSFYEGKYQTMAAGRSKKEARNAVAKALIDQIDLSLLPVKPVKGVRSPMIQRGGKRKNFEGEAEAENGDTKNKNNKRKRGFGDFNADVAPFGMGFGMNPLMMMGMNRMPPMGGMGGGMGGGMFPPRMRMNKDDHQVMTKHRAVYPTKEELKLILKITDTTEKCLKKISDQLCTEVVAPEGEEKVVEKKDESRRELLGVARVGDLSKGLLLTGDRAVSLVVMCRHKPTTGLLDQISSAVEKELKEKTEKEKERKEAKEGEFKGNPNLEILELEVHTFPEEAGFCIVYNKADEDKPYAVNVSLTSTKMRKNDQVKEVKEEKGEEEEGDKENGAVKEEAEVKQEIKQEQEEEEEDPANMLPRDKCLLALAELRHAKWFTSMAAPLDSCVESIRILKDISRRESAWTPVGDWGIELLVERALSSCLVPLTPSLAILRCLEVVASGIATANGCGIKDPCERDTVDVFGHLSAQERENLTFSAQEMVRKVHYRKIYQILGTEKPKPPQNRKDQRQKEKSPKESAAAAGEAVVVAGVTVVNPAT